MICFKDRQFCDMSDVCANADCPDRFDEVQRAAARAWWGGEGAPIAFGPMCDCAEYAKLSKQERQP